MLKSIVVAGFLPEIHICSWILVHFRCLDAFKPQVSHEAAVWPGGAGVGYLAGSPESIELVFFKLQIRVCLFFLKNDLAKMLVQINF